MEQKKNKGSTGSMKMLLLSLIVFFTLIPMVYFTYKYVDNIRIEMEDEKIESYKKEKEDYFRNLKSQFIAGNEASYIVTNKYITNDKTTMTVGSVLALRKGVLNLKNTKTNQVFEVEVTKDFYYRTANSQELYVIESKDGKLIQIKGEEEVFEKGNLLTSHNEKINKK